MVSSGSVSRRNPFYTPSSGGRSNMVSLANAMSPIVANAIPYGPQALAAARVIGRAYQAYKVTKPYRKMLSSMRNTKVTKKSRGTQTAVKKLSSKWSGTSTGMYRGGFSKPRRTKNPKVETLCLKKGYHVTNETSGLVEDPHCSYIGHSTWSINHYVRAIAGALLRKVMKKAGIQMDNSTQEVPLFSDQNSDGWKFEYVVYSPASGVSAVQATYLTIDDETLETILNNGFAGFKGHLAAYITKTDENEPYALNVYTSDRNGVSTNWRLAANLNLVNESVTLYASSTLKVQNRSAGAKAVEGEKYELDRIDNQPLQGYLYQFRNADPRLRFPKTSPTGGNAQLNFIVYDGITLHKASNLDYNFQEPPVPKIWNNCVKSTRVVLQPGDMKKAYIQFKAKGKLNNLLKYLRVERVTLDRYNGVVGKGQILALEEKIRTADANPITVQYERELKVGAITRTGPAAPMLSQYTKDTKNA